jgi:hypothetical protein
MYPQIILFLSIITLSNAFLQVPNVMFPLISKLEGIITTKAISTSFLTNLRSEFTIDRIFAEIAEMHYSFDYLYFSIFLTYAYGYYKYTQGAESYQIDKFKKIEKFDRIDRITKEIIFIFLFIFTKDVKNAI